MRFAALIQHWGLHYFPWIAYPRASGVTAAATRSQQVLVISASVGAGHVRAAEAICAGAALSPSSLPVKHLDAMDYVPRLFRRLYADLYILLVKNWPNLWAYVYHKTNHLAPSGTLDKMRRSAERLAAAKLRREILMLRPQAIICTHFLPAEILSDMRRQRELDCPLWVQVTDFDLHRLWVHPDVTGYFVAHQEIGYLLQSHGIPASKIHVTGIPVMPAFGQAMDRSECAQALGLDPEKTTVLVSGGGEGVGRLAQLAARLLPLHPDLQLIVLAGRNTAMLAELQILSQDYPGRLVALGYIKQVERVMACCDVAVVKPGGLTTSECLVMGLPMIFSSTVPGQEEHNADFLVEQGVALKATRPYLLEYRLQQLMNCPAQLEAMRGKAKVLSKSHAAHHVARQVQI